MIQLNIKNADGSHYWTEHFADQQLADAWLEEEKTRFYWDHSRTHEFVVLSEAVPNEQDILNAEAQAYLASTDWYVIRFADSGEPVPEEIKLKRAEARAKIVR